jgi:hypothetical protein
MGTPQTPGDLKVHACLHHKYPSTGKLERWPLRENDKDVELDLPMTAITCTLEPQICMVEEGLGLACRIDWWGLLFVGTAHEAGRATPRPAPHGVCSRGTDRVLHGQGPVESQNGGRRAARVKDDSRLELTVSTRRRGRTLAFMGVGLTVVLYALSARRVG